MFSGFLTRNLFLVGLVLIFSGIYLYASNYNPKPSPAKTELLNIVNETDEAIVNFGDDYINFLSGSLTPDEYKKSVLTLERRLKEIEKLLNDITPSDNQRRLYDKFKTGFILVYGVVQDNVKYLTVDNPDQDLLEKDQERMSAGLGIIQEVKEHLNSIEKSI